MSSALALAALSLAVWLYLLPGRCFFWLTKRPAPPPPPPPRTWPTVVAVVPVSLSLWSPLAVAKQENHSRRNFCTREETIPAAAARDSVNGAEFD